MKLALPLFVAVVLSFPSLALAQARDPSAEEAPPPISPVHVPVPVPVPDPLSSPAPPPALRPAYDTTPSPPRPLRYDYLRVTAGFRINYITAPAFDTFSTDDALAQASLDVTYAFWTRGKLALSAGAGWDVGSRTSGARGLTTKLTMHRLTVPIEARVYVTPWLDVFAKVAPGAGALYARVEDPSSPATLERAPWVFATDLSAGASFRVVGSNDRNPRRARLWITHELGYGLTTSASVSPSPNRDEASVQGSDERTNLGSLAMNGVFWRTGVSLSF